MLEKAYVPSDEITDAMFHLVAEIIEQVGAASPGKLDKERSFAAGN